MGHFRSYQFSCVLKRRLWINCWHLYSLVCFVSSRRLRSGRWREAGWMIFLCTLPSAPMLLFIVSPCTMVISQIVPRHPKKRSFFSYQTQILLTLRSSDSGLNYYLWTEDFLDNLGVSWGFSSLFFFISILEFLTRFVPLIFSQHL